MKLILAVALWSSSFGIAAAHTQYTVDAGRGPVSVLVPDNYRSGTAVPLVLSLHGFGGTGDSYVQYWVKNKQVDAKGFIVVAPTGRINSKGRSFWNATDACCDKDKSGSDDATYLRKLIETVEATYSIDPNSIHVTGYSNGGFMAHRMACEHGDKIASIASVAGAAFSQKPSCTDKPVHILHIHGTADEVIRYKGGGLKNYDSNNRVPHPGAVESVRFWAKSYDAAPVKAVQSPLDFSERTPGADTEILRFQRSSPSPVTVELWSITGETHVPKLNHLFHEQSTDWMLSHRKADPN